MTLEKQWQWQHCLWVGAGWDDLVTNNNIYPEKTVLPQVTKLLIRSLHLHGVSCFSQSISSSLDVRLRSRSEICRFDLTIHLGQSVFQGRDGHLSMLANVALYAHYGNSDNVFPPCPVWYDVIKQDNDIAVFVHDHLVDFR